MNREEITEKYLFLALEELSKHRGAIKRGRFLETAWRKEVLRNQVMQEAVEARKSGNVRIKL